MASNRALWYVAATKKSPHGTLYVRCHVKPGASKCREGVTAVNEDAVEVCVSAQAREGEANKALVKILSEVLDLPKSDLQIIQGPKSRQKTIAVVAPWVNAGEQECLTQVKAYLDKASSDA
ncbi:hypothetical protein B0T22DRAFT_376339 [Podospora appendiculata]|uniref:Uncharacterized protein n=1 Tax=Podospora appendiculata TaxID=314037 RepID=A0AAE1CDR2_9PEZI|nr:hypothetical protein B0T22DRAFT_376339 [Podospora appendiculata]